MSDNEDDSVWMDGRMDMMLSRLKGRIDGMAAEARAMRPCGTDTRHRRTRWTRSVDSARVRLVEGHSTGEREARRQRRIQSAPLLSVYGMLIAMVTTLLSKVDSSSDRPLFTSTHSK